MVHEVLNWRGAIVHSGLEPLTRLVLHTLSVHMTAAGENCFPSYATLAQECGISRESAKRHIKKALEAGWIAKTSRTRDDGSASSNEYDPMFPDGFALPKRNAPPPKSGRHADTPPPGGVGTQSAQGGVTTDPGVGSQSAPNIDQLTSPFNITSPMPACEVSPASDDIPDDDGDDTIRPSDLMTRFAELRREYFPNSGKKVIRTGDWDVAEQILRCGAPVAFCADVIEKRLKYYRKNGKDGAYPLSYFNKAIASAWKKHCAETGACTGGSRVPIAVPPEPDGLDPIWRQARAVAREILDDAVFASWIYDLEIIDHQPGQVLLSAPSKFKADYVHANYFSQLKRAFDQAAQRDTKLQIIAPILGETVGNGVNIHA